MRYLAPAIMLIVCLSAATDAWAATCPNGHEIDKSWTFCDVCGVQLKPVLPAMANRVIRVTGHGRAQIEGTSNKAKDAAATEATGAAVRDALVSVLKSRIDQQALADRQELVDLLLRVKGEEFVKAVRIADKNIRPDGTCYVRASVEVRDAWLRYVAREDLGLPPVVAVLMPEIVNGQPATTRRVEDALRSALIESGVEVLNLSYAEGPGRREVERAAIRGDTASVCKAAGAAPSDVFIFGKSEALPSQETAGIVSAKASVHMQAARIDSITVLFAKDYLDVKGFGLDFGQAAAKALTAAAQKAGTYAAGELARLCAHDSPRSVILLAHQADSRGWDDLLAGVGRIEGVSDVHEQSPTPRVSRLRCQYKGTALQLGEAIERLIGWVVSDYEEGAVKLRPAPGL